ncbi:MAG TPA: EamA family transporter [Candidatus Cybelea sp.]|nr:EamA family transporter [Candidatus Cybelea sp.]
MAASITWPTLGPASEADPPAPAMAAPLATPVVRSAFGRLPPTALLLFAILAVQLGAALATVLLPSIGPIGTTFAIALGSALVLTLYVRPRIDRRLKRHWRLVLLFGLINAVMALPYFLALGRIPLGILATVTFLGPLGLAVATSRRLLHFGLIGIAALGVALLTPEIGAGVGGDGAAALDPIGLLYAAVAAVGWAAFVPLSKRMGEVLAGLEGMVYAFWIEALVLLLPALLEAGGAGGSGAPGGNPGSIAAATPGDLLAVLGVALLSTALPNALEYKALQRMSARTYGILVTLEPAAGAMVGVVCLGQPAGSRMVIAIGCVMLAALGITLSDRRDSSDS